MWKAWRVEKRPGGGSRCPAIPPATRPFRLLAEIPRSPCATGSLRITRTCSLGAPSRRGVGTIAGNRGLPLARRHLRVRAAARPPELVRPHRQSTLQPAHLGG